MTIPMFLNCKQRLLTIYFDIQASTFNPLGSLSSTDSKTNKKEKLQKVKVRNKKWNYQNHKFWIILSRLWIWSPKLLAMSPLSPLNVGMLWSTILTLIKNRTPPSTTPPTPRAPPAGLFASSPAPWTGQGHCQAGYLLPGHKQTVQVICLSWFEKIGFKTGWKTGFKTRTHMGEVREVIFELLNVDFDKRWLSSRHTLQLHDVNSKGNVSSLSFHVGPLNQLGWH